MAGKKRYSPPALFLPLMFFCPLLRRITTPDSNKSTNCSSSRGLCSNVHSNAYLSIALTGR